MLLSGLDRILSILKISSFLDFLYFTLTIKEGFAGFCGLLVLALFATSISSPSDCSGVLARVAVVLGSALASASERTAGELEFARKPFRGAGDLRFVIPSTPFLIGVSLSLSFEAEFGADVSEGRDADKWFRACSVFSIFSGRVGDKREGSNGESECS